MTKLLKKDYPNIICINFNDLDFKIDEIYMLEYNSIPNSHNRPSLILKYIGVYYSNASQKEGKIIVHNKSGRDEIFTINDPTLVFEVISTNKQLDRDDNKYGFSISYRDSNYVSEFTLLTNT